MQMEMNKAMKMFVKNEVASASARWIYQAMSVLQAENKEKTIKDFLDELEEGISDERVCYLQITLLRYRTSQKRPFYQIRTFGPEFYLASPLDEKEVGWDWLYEPYYRFCEEITASSKKYVMQISNENLSQLCLLELEETKPIIRRMFQESLFGILTGQTFQREASKRDISFHLSDYMGEYESLLVLNDQTKETGEWLNGVFQNYSGNKI